MTGSGAPSRPRVTNANSPGSSDWFRIALGVGGAAALAAGIGADIVRGYWPDFGPAQWAAVALGALLSWLACRAGRADTPPPDMRDRVRAGAVLGVTVLWCALVLGLIEVAVLAVERHMLHRLTFAGSEYVWMTPLSWTAILFPLAVGFAAAGFSLPRFVGPWIPVFAVGSVGATALLLLFPRLHVLAALLLAIGIAWRLAVLVRGHSAGSVKLIARSTPVFLVALAALAGLRIASSSPSPARFADEAGGAGRPNVLLIILDTVRAPSLGLYGHDQPTTPNLEAFAAGAATYDRAISSSSWTLPAHATLFTGTYPDRLSTDWLAPLDESRPTLAEAFRDSGYDTAGFVANLFYTSRESGLARGFEHYDDFMVSWPQVFVSSNLGQRITWALGNRDTPKRFIVPKPGGQVTGAFLEWLDAAGGQPFFAFLNYFDAHQPYRFRGEDAERFDIDTLEGRYDAAIAGLDAELDSLFEQLRQRDLLDGTIVVVTSDHGEHLGEHGLTEHGNSLYMPLLHVPLVIRYPARVPAARVPDVVTLRDVPSTILDLAGLRPELGDSRSLTAAWGDRRRLPVPAGPVLSAVTRGINTPPHEPVSLGDMWSVVEGDLHYIRNGDGREELYRYPSDPGETVDLAGDPGSADQLRSLRSALVDLTGADDPSTPSPGVSIRPPRQ